MPIVNSLSQSKLSPTQIYEMERKMEADITEGLWEVRKRIITDVVNSYSDRLLDMQTFHDISSILLYRFNECSNFPASNNQEE